MKVYRVGFIPIGNKEGIKISFDIVGGFDIPTYLKAFAELERLNLHTQYEYDSIDLAWWNYD